MIKILKGLNKIPRFHYKAEPTIHFSAERNKRLKLYVEEHGKGEPIMAFVVDKGHENGLEVHVICDNRLVYVYNSASQRLITVLYARPKQIARYGKGLLDTQLNKYEQGWNLI